MQPCRQFMINDVTVCLLSTPLLLLCVIGTYERPQSLDSIQEKALLCAVLYLQINHNSHSRYSWQDNWAAADWLRNTAAFFTNAAQPPTGIPFLYFILYGIEHKNIVITITYNPTAYQWQANYYFGNQITRHTINVLFTMSTVGNYTYGRVFRLKSKIRIWKRFYVIFSNSKSIINTAIIEVFPFITE